MAKAPTNYLAQYDKAPAAKKYPLVQGWMKTEPLEFFAQLRAERPVLVTPECTLVANFVDVRDILMMPLVFTVDLYKPKMGAVGTDDGYLMAYDDNPLHYREKSLMQGMLNRNDLPVVRNLIATAGDKILNDANGHIEIVNQYCRMVPAILVQDYFGLDGIDKASLIKWSFWNQYDVFHNQPFDMNSPEKFQHIVDEHDKVTKDLVAYVAKLLLRKLGQVKAEEVKKKVLLPLRLLKKLLGQKPAETAPDYDIVKRMLRSSFAREVDFGLQRIGLNAGGLLIGSIETTSQAVAQTIQYFLTNPDLLADARKKAKAKNTKPFDALVWEALRYVPISPFMFRQAAQDYAIARGTPHETLIKKGTNVLVLTQSAMFDPYAYTDPDTFNPDRNFYHNFNFGYGPHECLGLYVGMELIPEMVRQVVLRPKIKADAPIDYKDGPFPEELNLSWS